MSDATAVPAAPPSNTTPPAEGAAPAPAPKAPVKASAPAAPPEEFEIKVDGKVQKLTRDQIIARAQKAEAADRRIAQATEAIKKSDQLLAELKSDPEATLLKLGLDPDEFIAAHVEKKAKQAQLTPEQKERQALEEKLAAFEAKEKKAAEEQKTKAQQAADEKTFQQLEETLLTAAKTYGLDQNPATLEQLCDVALEAIDMGYTLTADQVCQEVIAQQREHISARDRKVLAKLEGDKLLEYLGPEVLKKVAAARLAKIPGPAAAPKKEAPEPKVEKSESISEAEFMRKFARR